MPTNSRTYIEALDAVLVAWSPAVKTKLVKKTGVEETEVKTLAAMTEDVKIIINQGGRATEESDRKNYQDEFGVEVTILALMADSEYATVQLFIDFVDDLIEQGKTTKPFTITYDPYVESAQEIQRNVFMSRVTFTYIKIQ